MSFTQLLNCSKSFPNRDPLGRNQSLQLISVEHVTRHRTDFYSALKAHRWPRILNVAPYHRTWWRLKMLSARLGRGSSDLQQIFLIPRRAHRHAKRIQINVGWSSRLPRRSKEPCQTSWLKYTTFALDSMPCWTENQRIPKNEIEKMLSQKTIEAAQKEWAAPTFIALNKLDRCAFALTIVNWTP